MLKKNPYQIIKSLHVTEKAHVLQGLKNAKSNKSTARCESPKCVFIVDRLANKHDIARAIEEIYQEMNLKVVAVNTINMKPKPRRVRGRSGMTAGFKKAIVTFDKDDNLDNL